MMTIERRTLLKMLNGPATMLMVPVAAVKDAVAASFPTRTIETGGFFFDPATGMINWKRENREEKYYLTVDGLVEKPITLGYEDLRRLPAVTMARDFHCVEGWTVPEVKWSGFRFEELLKLVKPKDGANYVVFHAMGRTSSAPGGQSHYLESFDLAALLDPDQDILLALDMDGVPLSQDRGAPLRVIAPYRLAYKSIKFVNRVEFSDRLRPGWWTLANPIYDWDALVPVKKHAG